MARLIGILGGTFDPIHHGHLCPVHHLAQQMEFFKIHFVLSARPPHRNIPKASITHRYKMLTLALDDYPQFMADDQEILRPGPSFTVWTIRKLRQHYENVSLCLIVGMDAYLHMHHWYRWPDIVALANIVVLPRPGWKTGQHDAVVDAKDLSRKASGIVMFARSHQIPVTATDIRTKLSRGEDVSHEIPDKVLAYILENHIYRTKECYE